jgi:hypothetical protein
MVYLVFFHPLNNQLVSFVVFCLASIEYDEEYYDDEPNSPNSSMIVSLDMTSLFMILLRIE